MIEVDKENYEEEVLEADQPVMVDYWGEGCEHCLELMPGVEELAEKYGSDMKFAKLNIKGNRRLAMSQQVIGLPSMVFYVDGEKVAHLSGDDLTLEEIEEQIQEIIA
ncbi:MAG: thioredoxin TrxA [Bacillota bacterium]